MAGAVGSRSGATVPKVGRDTRLHSVLSVEVSLFPGYVTSGKPQTVNLLEWLQSPEHRADVERIRAIDDKQERDRLKAKLPCVTPSGLFSEHRASCLIRHSGLLQFDIDAKDNPHIRDMEQLRLQLSNIVNVAYCGLSVSGRGCWGLVPLAFPERHGEQSEALCQDFERLGVVLDRKPKSVVSLRGYAYDPDAYFKHNAVPYQGLATPIIPLSLKRDVCFKKERVWASQDIEKVELLLAEVEECSLDITGSYGAWFEVGCALAAIFGEAGRDYFHAFSRYHPRYDVRESDRQYGYCLRWPYRYKYGLGTLFHHGMMAGARGNYKAA